MEQGLSGFNSTPAGLNLLSKPAQDVRAESSALHLKKFPWKCQVWGFGCRNGVEWCCSVLVHLEISEVLWEGSVEPWDEFGSASVSSGDAELGPLHRSQIWNFFS